MEEAIEIVKKHIRKTSGKDFVARITRGALNRVLDDLIAANALHEQVEVTSTKRRIVFCPKCKFPLLDNGVCCRCGAMQEPQRHADGAFVSEYYPDALYKP